MAYLVEISPETKAHLMADSGETVRDAQETINKLPDESDAQSIPTKMPRRSILELDGLGAEIWKGIDAQEYINELRREWDERP